jgi:WS/DGAT/MGAT family acyltransferase
MARYSFERLSTQDATFLFAEGDHAPMHVGALAVLEAGALEGEAGGVDIERYRQAVEAVLHWIPRYRQKLTWVPVEGWPVWIDDAHFDLGYHVRHISLPRPGTLAQLREMAARILARPLDRTRPLWEIWVIEGLENGEQFALLNKIHHCMIDGAAGANLSQVLLSPSMTTETPPPVPYIPRPQPSPLELAGDAVRRAVSRPLDAMRAAGALLTDESIDVGAEVSRRAAALKDLAGWVLAPASETPINGELGPNRSFDWMTMPLDDVRELRGVLGCTVNDIVLATVAGAMRRYLYRRRVDPAELDFRVSAPVSLRRGEEANKLAGNQVSSWIVQLPLEEMDAVARVEAIRARTLALKEREASLGVATMMSAAEWLPAPLLKAGAGLAQGPINMIVTNVPGPQFPLYSVGARLLGMYPSVPLLPGTGLGVALFSYEGRLCWGFQADPACVPDLDAFVEDVGGAFEELRQATVASFLERRTGKEEQPEAPAAPRKPKRRRKGAAALRVEGAEASPPAAKRATAAS